MEAEPTGPVRVREYPVHPALAPYVKCPWSLESARPILDPPRERILPDTCVELVFHFHDPFVSHFAGGGTARQPQSFVVGQMTRFLEIQPAGRAGFVAVRFHARGAYLFFRRPLREVAGGGVGLAELSQPPGRRVDRARGSGADHGGPARRDRIGAPGVAGRGADRARRYPGPEA